MGNLNGVDRTAFSSLLHLTFLLWEDLVPGGGNILLRHHEDTGTQVGTQTASDTVVVDMDSHGNSSFLEKR